MTGKWMLIYPKEGNTVHHHFHLYQVDGAAKWGHRVASCFWLWNLFFVCSGHEVCNAILLTCLLEPYGIAVVMDGFEFGDFKRAWGERFTEEPPLELDCFTSEPGVSARDKFESTLLDCKARIEFLQEELAQQEFVSEYLTIALQSKYGLDSLPESPAPAAMYTPTGTGSPIGSAVERDAAKDKVEETDIDAVTDVDVKYTRLSSTNLSPKWTVEDSEELKQVRFSAFSDISHVTSSDTDSPSGIGSSPDVMLQRDRDTVRSNALDSPVVCPPPQAYAEERIYDEPFAVVKGEVDESAESSDEEPVYYNVLLMKHQSMATSHAPVYANTSVLEKKRADMAAKCLTDRTSSTSSGMYSPSKLDTSLSPTGKDLTLAKCML